MTPITTPIPFALEVHSSETIGKRKDQQDAFLIERAAPQGPIRVSLADGLGGHARGSEASKVAVRKSTEVLRADDEEDASSFHDLFKTAFLSAHHGIKRIPWHRGEGASPASTLITALAYPQGEVRLAGVGDSVAWGIRDGHPKELLPRQGEANWVRYCLGHDIGSPPGAAIEHGSWVMTAGDQLLLASDGITTLSPQAILDVLTLNPADPAKALIDAVLEKDYEFQDNCAIVIITAKENSM